MKRKRKTSKRANLEIFSKKKIERSYNHLYFFTISASAPPSRTLFMDGVQLSQSYRATSRRQFTFYSSVPNISQYSFNRLWEDERLSQPWSHPVVLNLGPQDWELSAINNMPLLHNHLAT